MIDTLTHYTDLFGVTKPEMEEVVAEALRGGGDWADLYFENSWYRSMVLRDGQVTSGGFHIDYGVGIRVLKGDKTGYAYTESTAKGDMLPAAKAAASIATGAAETPLSRTFPFKGKPNPAADKYPVEHPWRGSDASDFIPKLTRLEELIRAKDGRVLKVIGVLSVSESDILMYDSCDELKYETRPLAMIAASVVFSDGSQVINGHVSKSFRMGTEMVTEALLEEMAEEAVKNLDARFEAKRPKGGEMPVVMGAGASGILLHEAMGHAFEADFNRKGQSIFAGRIGERVAMNGVNIIDDGTIKANRGSMNYDDEGVPARKTYMVEDGVLTSYLHDRISARHYGIKPTGNGRRESFRYNPIPRMRCTYMESGDTRPEDIIASVKKGIFVDVFSNGQVKIGEGDFTFFVNSGFLIEDGRLTQPIKDINVIGNGPQALADMVAVGDDAKIDDGAWTCGKGQNVPVSCGIPTVLVSKLTVGGE